MEHVRRQQRKACDVCRRRKVRCDIATKSDGACSVCAKTGLQCIVPSEWRKPRRRSTRDGSRVQTARPTQPIPIPSQSPQSASVYSTDRTIEIPPNQTSPSTTVSGLSASGDLARRGLSQFFDTGIESSSWRVFNTSQEFRIAYIGTPTSNLAHLVKLRSQDETALPQPPSSSHPSGVLPSEPSMQHTELPLSTNQDSTYEARSGSIALIGAPLHYPYPPIRSATTPESGSTAPLSGFDGLLGESLNFPEPEIRRALVNAYIEHVHPSFPILARSDILHYNVPSQGSPYLLLSQAVLLAGAHVCDHPFVARDRQALKSIIYKRAALLFHLRCETDRLQLTQAALLFSWHINDGDTVSGGSSYWIGVAMRISCGQGIHRANNRLPMFEYHFYKRTWWIAFVAEVFSALETGRPCAIRAEDIDQTFPTKEELTWEPEHSSSTEHSPAMQGSDMPYDYHISMIKLAYIALDVSAANAPCKSHAVDVASIDKRLASWSLGSELNKPNENYFDAQLKLHYNLVLLHLHRNFKHEGSHSTHICQIASEAIISSFDRITTLGAMNRCYFTSVSAVIAAGIQTSQEIHSATMAGETITAVGLLGRLDRLLAAIQLLSDFWPNAEAAHHVFSGLKRKYEDTINKGLEPLEHDFLGQHLDWDDMFTSIMVPRFEGSGAEQEWANFTWENLPEVG